MLILNFDIIILSILQNSLTSKKQKKGSSMPHLIHFISIIKNRLIINLYTW